MGGANTKALNASVEADLNDPRSPSLKRTPLSTPASAGPSEATGWRQAAAALRAAQDDDPRSPSAWGRTPLREPSSSTLGDMTPLALSYGVDYLKNSAANPMDPRSPMGFRTPLHATQGIVNHESPVAVVACGAFVDDTVVIGDFREEPKTQSEALPSSSTESTTEKPITVSAVINTTTLSGMNIFSSKEDVQVEDEIVEEEIPIVKNDVLQAPATPSSPSRPIAISTEEVSKTEKVFVPPKLTQSGYVSSPALLSKDPVSRKRKNPMKQELLGVSPLKKSFSSPACTFENDENEILPPSPKTPTTARRASIKTAASQAGNRSPRTSQSPRSPLSPITPRTAKRRAPKLNREASAPILL